MRGDEVGGDEVGGEEVGMRSMTRRYCIVSKIFTADTHTHTIPVQ